MKVALVIAALAAAAAAPAPGGAPFAVTPPPAWKPLPEAAAAARAALGGDDAHAATFAYGDARAGVFAVGAWRASAQPVASGRGHAEAEAAMAALKAGLGAAAAPSWKRADRDGRLEATFATASADAEQVGRAAVVVDRHGIVHGYLLTCTRAGDARTRPATVEAARAGCDAVLASMTLPAEPKP
jgi:hypothetical protein